MAFLWYFCLIWCCFGVSSSSGCYYFFFVLLVPVSGFPSFNVANRIFFIFPFIGNNTLLIGKTSYFPVILLKFSVFRRIYACNGILYYYISCYICLTKLSQSINLNIEIMKKLKQIQLAFLALLLFSALVFSASAQEYKIEGDKIVKVEVEKEKAQPIATGLTHTIKGIDYPVYKGKKGGYYIIRVSKKSGKEYRQYLKLD